MTLPNIKPMHDFVALKVDVQQAPSSTIIAVIKEPASTGTVVALGDYTGCSDINDGMDLSIGDRVHFNHTAGSKIKVDGEEILIIPYKDIFARVLP